MSTPQDAAQPANEVRTYRTCQRCHVVHWHESACPQCGKKNPTKLDVPDDGPDVRRTAFTTYGKLIEGSRKRNEAFYRELRKLDVPGVDSDVPAPLSDEEVEEIRSHLHPTYPPDAQKRRLIATITHWKQRAEEMREERDAFLCQAHGAWNPECLGCVVEQVEEADKQLADIRFRLGGSPDSKLDGDDGLAAATMREVERLREELSARCEQDSISDLIHSNVESIKDTYERAVFWALRRLDPEMVGVPVDVKAATEMLWAATKFHPHAEDASPLLAQLWQENVAQQGDKL